MNARRILRRQLRMLGWPGVLGLGLLVFAGSFYVSGFRPAEARLDSLQMTIESRQRELERPDAAHELLTPEAQLVQFHKALPDAASQPDWLEKIFAIAGKQGIEIEQGDYKRVPSLEGRIVRLHITFPLKSNYPQIRRFIAQLKAEIPVLAIEQVQFERQKVADANLDARLQLVLFMEPSK